MSSTGKSREQLVSELSALRERVKELESRAKDPAQHEHRFDEMIGSIQGCYEAAYEAILLTEEGVCLGLNHAARQMFGCATGDAVGKPVEQWIVEEDRAIITHNLFSGSEQSYEVTMLRKDGSTLPAEIRAHRVQFGQRTLYAVALRDRQIEQELTKTQSLLTSVIEQSPTPIAIARPDGSLEIANDAAKELLGIADLPDVPEVLEYKQPWKEYDAKGNLIADDQMALVLALNGIAVKGKEVRVVREDGSERWVLVDSIPVYDAGGNLIAGVAIFPDITELKAIEQQLRTSLRHLTALMDNSNDYILISDETGTPLIFNDAYRKVIRDTLGIEMKPGIKPHKLLDDPSAVAFWEGLHRRVLSGESFRAEHSYMRTTGEIRHFESNFTPIIEDGEVKGFSEISRDITERRHKEELLKESETRFRAIFESSVDAIAVSREGVHIALNEAFMKMFGYDDPDELVGQPIYTLVAPSQREHVSMLVRRRVASAEFPLSYETVGIRKDGTEFDVDVQVSTYDLGGKVYTVTFLRDITERKKADRALRESRARLETLLHASPIGIILLSNRNFLEVNDTFCTMLGYSRDELIGQSARLLYPSQDEFERIGQVKYDLIREQGIGTIETQWVRKDGTVLNILLRSAPLDPDNWELGVISTSLDITERKRAEKALQDSEQRLGNIIRALPLGMHLYRLEADDRLIFTGSNPAADQILGVDNQQFVGKTLEEAFPPMAGTEVPDRYRRAASEGESWFAEQIDYEHGEISGAFEVNAFQISRGQMGTLFRDITARKQAQQELERYRNQLEDLVAARTAELEAANVQLLALSQVKDEFISNVSHELRSPITSLKVNLHALTMLPEKRNTYTESLRRELTRLENLVENLLTVSRLDQERVEFSFEPVDLDRLLQVYVDDRQAVARQQGLTLAIEKSPGLPPVNADINQMDQVISILLTNALNYTPAGGTVTISTRTGRRDDRDYVCFSVSDTGPGIPPDEQSRLFERFFRGQVGRDSGAPGTGLGLSIAKEIVDRHGGLILAANKGKRLGAVFTVWLPIEGGEVG